MVVVGEGWEGGEAGRGGGSGLCWLWTRTEGGRAGWNVWVGRRVERDASKESGWPDCDKYERL